MSTDKDDEIMLASGLSVAHCKGCGSIHLYLHDEDGEVFATAILDLEEADDFAQDMDDEIKKGIAVALEGGCEGHA